RRRKENKKGMNNMATSARLSAGVQIAEIAGQRTSRRTPMADSRLLQALVGKAGQLKAQLAAVVDDWLLNVVGVTGGEGGGGGRSGSDGGSSSSRPAKRP